MMKLLVLAGEESGVHYAERISAAVRTRCPDAEIRGYADYGFRTADLAVFGIWAVLKRIFFFFRVKRTMVCAIDEWKPDVVCTIDYPGMNLKLASYAKSKGIWTVHVVCPQVWAWHQGRIPKIERSMDRLCCFFPFEPAMFRPGFAEFVGHPLAQEFKNGLEGDGGRREKGLVALLPGSRLGEIEKHLPTLLDAVAPMEGIRVAIPAANDGARAAIERIVSSRQASGAAKLKIPATVQSGGARELLRRAEVAAVASGTATLEAALAHCPTVLVYRVGAVLAAFLRRAIKGIRHVGLANIIAEKSGAECPMPELLQENFTAEAVRGYLERWLGDSAARAEAAAKLEKTLEMLESDGDAYGRIADILSQWGNEK